MLLHILGEALYLQVVIISQGSTLQILESRKWHGQESWGVPVLWLEELE